MANVECLAEALGPGVVIRGLDKLDWMAIRQNNNTAIFNDNTNFFHLVRG